ncbi:RsmB/NOP family class I SAM-dependent RNA methyltransferase [Thermoproteus tenax]|uniref:tRNA (cytosine(72)-C(5))-methyltransferase n=1 Tax=Thermoproteus tenax (strain ATCC 35583 / DSM 2078 / JCM 9277 / NBRC 100435 / Kra 1) TaxID=768679 RepID=G4RP98_THETK|nr:tRNA and rRNA cytosine-C5-methylase [Thermoproteus tenax Kra 1]
MDFIDFNGIRLDYLLYKHLLEFLSERELEALFELAKRPPSRYYIRVNTSKITPEALLSALSRNIEVRRDEHIGEALWIPVQGPFKVPEVRRRVVAEKRAAESVYMGADLYAPGVLKAPSVKAGDEVNVVSPDGQLVAYGIAEMDGDAMLKTRRGLAVRTLVSVYKAPKLRELDEYRLGYFYDQSYPAMWVGLIARALGASTAIDLNSSPGGKTTHLAQYGIRVIAVDRSRPKVDKIRENAERLGLTSLIDLLEHDSRYLDRDFPRLKAEIALVDPPCTDLGVRPKLGHTVTMIDVETLARYQRQFLSVASRIARYIIYSTCTLTYQENEENITWATRELGLEVLDIDPPRSVHGWGACPLCRRSMPTHFDAPGFFLALLRRR